MEVGDDWGLGKCIETGITENPDPCDGNEKSENQELPTLNFSEFDLAYAKRIGMDAGIPTVTRVARRGVDASEICPVGTKRESHLHSCLG